MYMFYAKPLALDARRALWFMVGSEVGLAYEAIPGRIEGFSRLKWPRVVLFLKKECLSNYGRYGLDDHDVIFHMGDDMHVDVASEAGVRLEITDYAMLSRLLRALVVDRMYFVVDVSETALRLVSPTRRKPRRSSLVMCCGSSDVPAYELSVCTTMQLLGAEAGGNGSPVCSVKNG